MSQTTNSNPTPNVSSELDTNNKNEPEIKTQQESKEAKEPKLVKPEDWADSIGSLSVISALIFGFSAAVLTNIHQPQGLSKQKELYFAAFIILLCVAIGLSFIGLAVSSIMYHNVKGFTAYGLEKIGLKEYERKSYLVKNIGYYCIYISWAALIIAIIMYCWVYFDEYISNIITALITIMLTIGILMGGYLANIYASYSGDQTIFNVMNPQRIEQYQHRVSTINVPMTEIMTMNQQNKSNSQSN